MHKTGERFFCLQNHGRVKNAWKLGQQRIYNWHNDNSKSVKNGFKLGLKTAQARLTPISKNRLGIKYTKAQM